MAPTRDESFQTDRPAEKEYEQFEMCDSACQTRESLFDPPMMHQSNHQATPMPHPSPPAPFSTFGYKKEDRYRTESKIRIEKLDKPDKRGPYSIQSTKSAPDVIVTHWRSHSAEWEPYKRRHPRHFLRTSSKVVEARQSLVQNAQTQTYDAEFDYDFQRPDDTWYLPRRVCVVSLFIHLFLYEHVGFCLERTLFHPWSSLIIPL